MLESLHKISMFSFFFALFCLIKDDSGMADAKQELPARYEKKLKDLPDHANLGHSMLLVVIIRQVGSAEQLSA